MMGMRMRIRMKLLITEGRRGSEGIINLEPTREEVKETRKKEGGGAQGNQLAKQLFNE